MKSIPFLIVIFTFFSCNSEEQESQSYPQAIGESARPVVFQGDGAGPVPSYQERALSLWLNRLRVNADNFGIKDRAGNPVPPLPPRIYSTSAAEAGRWQGKHALEFSCDCPQSSPADDKDFNTCCEIGFVDGIAQCVSAIVDCGSEQATTEQDRWAVLNSGDSSITSEQFLKPNDEKWEPVFEAIGSLAFSRINMFSPAQVSVGIPPMNCKAEESSCGAGKCLDSATMEGGCEKGGDANPDCIGQCAGGARAGGSCIIPAPLGDECLPENYPRSYYWTLGSGVFNGESPSINDALHILNPGTMAPAFYAHYADKSGDPQKIQIIHSKKCVDMNLEFARPAQNDFPFHGDTYTLPIMAGDLANGCIKYIVAATDADGFNHTYPSLGSLQANILDNKIVPNDETCPIWTPARVDTACLPVSDQCQNGETRKCYTGREGTQGKGLCEAGTETCKKGRWEGFCDGEILPALDDTCDDEEDNNCNGFANEGCPIVAPPKKDMGSSEKDMGTDKKDMNNADMGGSKIDIGMAPPKGSDSDEGCCATVSDAPRNSTNWLLPVMLLGLAFLRKKRS